MKKFVLVSRGVFILCAALLITLPVQAGLISVASYSYGTSPHSNYPDSGGELTDGITDSLAWGDGVTIGYADVANLSGWYNSDPVITFNFSAAQMINSIRIFAADSDGWAGVSLPVSLLVSTAEGFSELFSVTNPAGNGSTVALDFGGFSTTSSAFTLSMVRSAQWTMLSEVQFFSNAQSPTNDAPEPGTWLIMLCGMAYIARKRIFSLSK
ncbi:hypothetical protein [Paraglaciecola hydrolytica]|uniref:PEP-CTERM protein-sorting domain-containing protein n=1 Tax=Paraglaciecola hydrolytica TaxID=1799789 RepID=A0A136A3Y5_9ALTE|nr:hypothetical protein [Paraglaciecola hydrolytica]KXI29840.1 hypothetical protein AX660_07360 [Paraglaciecola hydrolytica]